MAKIANSTLPHLAIFASGENRRLVISYEEPLVNKLIHVNSHDGWIETGDVAHKACSENNN